MGSVTLGATGKQPNRAAVPTPTPQHVVWGDSVLSSSGSPALLDSRTTQDVAHSPETFTASLFLKHKACPH